MRKVVMLLIVALSMGAVSKAAFINDSAPDFSLKSMGDKEVRLADFKGEIVFINFWASWCPPCKKEFPELNELANEYKGQGLRVLAISLDKNQSRIEKFLEKIGTNPGALTILLDPDAKIVAAYVARSMPSSFVIDRKGVIRFVHFGYSEKDPMKWREEINLLQSEKK